MLLLHISDIHFKSPDCLDEDTDPEKPYRTMLLQDLARQCEKLGNVDAILVGGDIAFKGDPEEYKVAERWLSELATRCGCSRNRIYVVPGNHDVVRRVTEQAMPTRNSQLAIKNVALSEKEKEFRRQLNDEQAGAALFAPLAPYNDFARLYGCNVYPKHIYWKQDLTLELGVKLRIYGLTSCLLSNAGGVEDTPGSLYLSPLQTVLNPDDDVVNLVMSHHPPDWFSDHEVTDENICNRSAIHLFGHKHRQRLVADNSYIRFSAGAVNPDRYEPSWQPGYNLIDIEVCGEAQARVLNVTAYLRQWQANPSGFIPVHFGANDFRKATIAIPVAPKARSATAQIAVSGADLSQQIENKPNPETAMSSEKTRDLVYRFWKLRPSEQRTVITDLALLDGDEWKLTDNERYTMALIRAAQKEMLEVLAREIEKMEARHG
jgi:predicted phosphodiesterase